MMFDVSVVIPCHDGLKWLPETLRSVVNQTGVNVEVLLVDDGSEDGTVEWATSVESRQVRLLKGPPLGVTGLHSRLVGAREARGAFVALLDQDDLWAQEKLARQLRVFCDRPGTAAVGTLERLIDAAGAPGPVGASEPLNEERQALVRRARALPFVASSMVMRRTMALEVLEATESISPLDLAIFAEAARRGPLFCIDEPLTFRRWHMASQSANVHVDIAVCARWLEKVYDDPQRVRELSFDDFVSSGGVTRRELRRFRAEGLAIRAGYSRASGNRRAWAAGHVRALALDPLYRSRQVRTVDDA